MYICMRIHAFYYCYSRNKLVCGVLSTFLAWIFGTDNNTEWLIISDKMKNNALCT